MNQFLKQFDQVRVLMKQMAQMSMWQRLKMVTGHGQGRGVHARRHGQA